MRLNWLPPPIAAEAFSQITGLPVATIHSALSLRVQTDYSTNKTRLIPAAKDPEGKLLFIDEASYIDKELLGYIFKLTKNCKIVFMGDPAQLTPVKSSGTPVFDANFTGAQLSQVVRQAEGNPIVDLSTKFRETVKTGEFFSFKPDGEHIQYMDRKPSMMHWKLNSLVLTGNIRIPNSWLGLTRQ